MMPIVRLVMRVAFCAMVLPQCGAQAPCRTETADDSLARVVLPEVRMRKLHLVRPDLIPYPMAYEILC
jgi:hypothetical protein